MANNYFKIKQGLNVQPLTSSTVNTQGDIDYNSTSNQLEVYTTTTESITTNSNTQTITNKTISGSNNTITNIPTSATNATSANTPSTIVARDSSGNFSAGTITANLTGTASGNTTYTPSAGGLVYSGTSNGMGVLAAVSTGYILKSAGTLTAPTWSTLSSSDIPNNAANTTGTASNVTGTVLITHGGTGQTSASAAYNALSPMTTTGDIEYESGTNTAARLPIGSTNQVLTVVGGLPTWSSPAQAGSKNYLSSYTASTSGGSANPGNGNAELGTTSGFSLAHTALSSFIPTSVATAGSAFSSSSGGSAASANLSLSVVSSSQIAGTYSFDLASSAASVAGDMLISNPFYIDTEDQAKMMTVQFHYKNVSGTFNNSGTNANTFAIWIYDVTNAAWIMPAGVYGMVQGTGVGYATNVTFQTTSNSTQYQLALININATSGAYSLYLDDMIIGPQTAPSGPAMTDWQTYTVTIRGTGGTNPTKGTVVTDKGFWRRVGDSVEILYQYAQNGAGADGTGNYVFSLPNGIMVDTTKLDNANPALIQDQIGCSWSGYDGINTWIGNTAPAADGAANGFSLFGNVGVNGGVVSSVSSNYYVGANLLRLGLTQVKYAVSCRFPIVGWSSNTSMSSDTDTRVVAMHANNPTAQSFASGDNTVVFGAAQYDTHGAWNSSTNTYTAPVSGYYRVSAQVYASYGANGDTVELQVFKNGSLASRLNRWTSLTAGNAYNGNLGIQLSTGDTVVIHLNVNSTTGSGAPDGGLTYLDIQRLSGPAVVTATESVNARYNSSTTSISATLGPITYSSKNFDSHNEYSGNTYTIPVSGKYQVNASILVGGTFTAGTTTTISIYHNGSAYAQLTNYDGGASGNAQSYISDIVSCLAGDTIQINAASSATGASIVSSSTNNFFSISRIGN